MKHFGLLGATIQKPKWVVIFDEQHQWGANIPIQDAQTVLAGICQGMGLEPSGEKLTAFIRANLTKSIVIQWQGKIRYKGTLAGVYMQAWWEDHLKKARTQEVI